MLTYCLGALEKKLL